MAPPIAAAVMTGFDTLFTDYSGPLADEGTTGARVGVHGDRLYLEYITHSNTSSPQ